MRKPMWVAERNVTHAHRKYRLVIACGGNAVASALMTCDSVQQATALAEDRMRAQTASELLDALFDRFGRAAKLGFELLASDRQRGRSTCKLALPFGPFLALGGVVGLLVGDQMIDWYLNAFVR